jgi:hypothetical protein
MNAIIQAKKYVGVKEHPAGSNRGPEIDRWLKHCGAAVGNPWCAAFETNMVKEACELLGLPNEYILTASSQAIKRWAKVEDRYFEDPNRLLKCAGAACGWTNYPDTAHGHALLVQGRFTDRDEHGVLHVVAIHTVEGNTNGGGSRNGDGVYELRRGVPTDGRHRLWFVDLTGLNGCEWWG